MFRASKLKKTSLGWAILGAVFFLFTPPLLSTTAFTQIKPNPVALNPTEWTSTHALSVATREKLHFSPLDLAEYAQLCSLPRKRQTKTKRPPGKTNPGHPAAIQAGQTRYAVCNLLFTDAEHCAAFSVPGVSVFHRFQQFADVFVPLDETVLKSVGSIPGLLAMELDSVIALPLPPKAVLETSRGEPPAPEKIIRGGIAGLTGKGTLIAIVDSGVDFRNPDFITFDAAGKPVSRLRYLWDTTTRFSNRKFTTPTPVTYPDGAPVGTLLNRDQLTAELRSPRPRQIPATDLVGHGTACAGVAAGNGNNGKGRPEVIGVAPEADLIAVRIGKEASDGIGNVYLLGAICGWLDSVAGNQPLVISCSFGGHRGGHDGVRIIEQQLTARFSLDRTGRALVIAAGNEAAQAIHSEVHFQGVDVPALITLGAESEGARLAVYFDTDDPNDIVITQHKETKMEIVGGEINPFTKQLVGHINFAPGIGRLAIYSQSGKKVSAHLYLLNGIFAPENDSPATKVSTPGTTPNAITVGSYTWNNRFDVRGKVYLIPQSCKPFDPSIIGKRSCYSNPGFSRLGRVKPEIVAPGEVYYASLASLPNGQPAGRNLILDTSRKYRFFNGTSAATPYVAGVIALVFQKKPALTLGELRTLISSCASKQVLQANQPDPFWGYGKLDYAAVEQIISKL